MRVCYKHTIHTLTIIECMYYCAALQNYVRTMVPRVVIRNTWNITVWDNVDDGK